MYNVASLLLTFSPQKRKKRKEPQNEQDRFAKRTRKISDDTTTEPTLREISFDDVYQDGKATLKHEIIRYPKKTGDWYILRCEEHPPYTFTRNPIHVACRHLSRFAHDGKCGNTQRALDVFGIRVIGCTDELMERNNATARAEKYASSHSSSPKLEVTRGHERKPSTDFVTIHRTRTRGKSPVQYPQDGHVYLSYWSANPNPFGVIVLPMNDLSLVGLGPPLQSPFKSVLNDIPRCYDYDPQTGQYTWSSGYEEGGIFQNLREYPVMWFNEPTFPGTFSWVKARDLTHFEASSARALGVTKAHMKLIEDYENRFREREQVGVQTRSGRGQMSQDESSGGLLATFKMRDLLQFARENKIHVEGPWFQR